MTTYTCSTDPDPTKRAAPVERSSVNVVGRWTHHAYKMSHDEQTLIVHLADGIKVIQGEREVTYTMDLRAHNPREFIFSPDNSQVAFWAPLDEKHPHKRVALMNLGGLPSGEPRYQIVYDPPTDRVPFGMEWSPAGDALFVIERVRAEGTPYTVIRRFDLPGGKEREIVRMMGLIDFFMPPVSRFENGGGPSKKPYQLIFGARDGLYLTDPEGKRLSRISKLPAVGLHNIEWNPRPDVQQVALFFRFPSAAPDGRKFKGVYLVDIDRMAENPERDSEFMEHLYDGVDIHTLWFSPKGTYVTWAGKQGVYYRRPEDPPHTAVKLEVYDQLSDRHLEMRGATWSEDESRLVFTAEGRVMLHEVPKRDPKAPPPGPDEEKKELVVYEIASFEAGFVAEPRFVGNDVYLTVVEDIVDEMRELRSKPSLGLPILEPDDRLPSTTKKP